MHEAAGRRAGVDVIDNDASVLRDEDVVQRHAEAAGATHPHRVPVVDDFDLTHRNEEITWLLMPGRALAADTSDQPLGVPAAAGEGVTAADAPAGVGRSAHGPGHDRACGEGARI